DLSGYRFAGKTDKGIIWDVCEIAGIPEAMVTRKETDAMLWIVRELRPLIDLDSLRLLPNVRGVLKDLANRSDTTLGLLTGNLPGCAAIKLRPYSLGEFFRFGVFGIESRERNDLGLIAV